MGDCLGLPNLALMSACSFNKKNGQARTWSVSTSRRPRRGCLTPTPVRVGLVHFHFNSISLFQSSASAMPSSDTARSQSGRPCAVVLRFLVFGFGAAGHTLHRCSRCTSIPFSIVFRPIPASACSCRELAFWAGWVWLCLCWGSLSLSLSLACFGRERCLILLS